MTASKFPVANPTASFWLTQPHHLASYRSSETTPEECDIAIIGTGLAGVSTAYHILANHKGTEPKIVLFDARQACSGATGRNGGHIKVLMPSLKKFHDKFGSAAAQQLFDHVNSQMAAMKSAQETEGIDCDLFLTRSFDCYYDPAQASEIKAFLDQQREAGAKWTQEVQWLEGPMLEKASGMKGLIAAVSVPALTLWPYKFVTALLERVVEMGAFLYTETPVEKISTTNSGDDNNDSIITITTPRGVTKAKKVIYATNAYTSAVLPQYRNVIVPYRGQNSILVPLAKGQGHQPHLTYTRNLFHSGSSPGNADYLVPRPDGNIILGGGAGAYRKDEADRNAKWFDSVDDATLIDPGVKRHFDGVMARCFRGWEDCEATAAMTWSGIMGATPDGVPHVGQVPDTHSQWILAGFNGGGMPLIFTAARGVADMVCNGTSFAEAGILPMFQTTAERLESEWGPVAIGRGKVVSLENYTWGSKQVLESIWIDKSYTQEA
ncbi:hypothetical protein G7054_g11341 [Neopestalotiopsis clavispora]|nr:hypothetical protein G7054_g11341 [Neopestalotiopsis clavispora]